MRLQYSQLATQVVLPSGSAQQRVMRPLVQRPVQRVATLAHSRLDGGARTLVGCQQQEAKQLGHADVVVAEQVVVAAHSAQAANVGAECEYARHVDAQEHGKSSPFSSSCFALRLKRVCNDSSSSAITSLLSASLAAMKAVFWFFLVV
eukprot:3352132-Pleurochrysis_carterae.AAC.3